MKKKLTLLVLKYFRLLARLQLRKNPQAVLIGITGSAGKTSTRLALVRILRSQGEVKHSAHANSESGIPLNILGLTPRDYSVLDWIRLVVLAPLKLILNWEKYAYYVVEMGIDSPLPPKNMSYLLSILTPHIAIVLNAGLAHGGEFDHLVADRDPERRAHKIRRQIAQEKFKLASCVGKSGVAIVNFDQIELRDLLPQVESRLITFGTQKAADFRIIRSSQNNYYHLFFEYQSESYELVLSSYFEPAYSYNFAAAICGAAALGVPPAKSIKELQGYKSPRGRMRLFRGINNSHLIDSSYNASPDTMHAALTSLKALAGRAHKLAVLGDMRELGRQAKLAHKRLAEWIMDNADECLLFGSETRGHTLPVLEQAKFPVRHFEKMSALNKYLEKRVSAGSWILVKGSQNQIFLERAVVHLLADPADMVHLARRGRYWDQIRDKTP